VNTWKLSKNLAQLENVVQFNNAYHANVATKNPPNVQRLKNQNVTSAKSLKFRALSKEPNVVAQLRKCALIDSVQLLRLLLADHVK
jgi:hypothetical protein